MPALSATGIAKFIAILVSPLALYLVFLNVPQPLFTHHLTRGNIRIHSDRPIPPESRIYIDSASLLLARSPWNDTTLIHRIFVCQSRWRFALFTGRAYKVGAQNSVYMNRNIFVRPGFDFDSMREAFRNGEPKMDPFLTGFYWRYQLMVQYLLEVRKVGLDELFRESFPVPELEKELRARS